VRSLDLGPNILLASSGETGARSPWLLLEALIATYVRGRTCEKDVQNQRTLYGIQV
jgi:hypothetical protein